MIRAKEELSLRSADVIDLEYQGRRYRRELTRDAAGTADYADCRRTLGPCRQCIKDAGVAVEDIAEVVLVGGSTRIPLVRKAVETCSAREPHTELNPDEVVALGAAVQAGILRATWRTRCCWM